MQDFPSFNLNDGIFHKILLVPQKLVMALNNVMPRMSQSSILRWRRLTWGGVVLTIGLGKVPCSLTPHLHP